MNSSRLFFFTILLFSLACKSKEAKDEAHNTVTCVSAMKNVMWKGELQGKVLLDTLNKKHLYGIGPVEYLQGELLIIDGNSYMSTVISDTTMSVEETYQVKAPFFVYGNVREWYREALPAHVKNLKDLETYVNLKANQFSAPFVFKLNGTVAQADIHVQNLPSGSEVNSPQDAHKGQTNFSIENEMVEIVGFYSTEHKGIFTHHDTNMHLHLITEKRDKMGHLDKVLFDETMQVHFPK